MYKYDIILSFITAFTLTYFAIPSVIRVARIKNLTDDPNKDERRSHAEITPSLGGIAIFAGTLFSIVLWMPFEKQSGNLQYILCAFIIIFLIGAKDDIDPISPTKKLIGEILAASILFLKADIKLNLGLHEFLALFGLAFESPSYSYFISYVITVFTILVIINAFNLIDGINGLSGSIATLIAVTFGWWFFNVGRTDLAIVAFSLTGAVIAFLKYNFTPAKIFMGDTGALLIGLICSILVIEFIELNYAIDPKSPLKINAAPAVAIGILILPLFDTLRVFTTRILRGRSPLSPDRNHIHHLLIDLGLSHMEATGVLVVVNFIFIVMVFLVQLYTNKILVIMALVVSIASLLMGGVYFSFVRRQKRLAKLDEE